jgi:dephospho-CoA kinase
MAAERSQARPHVLGLTGGIGCGKSTVAELLLQRGALRHIDADQVVHHLMAAGSPTSAAIGQTFGQEVLAPDGSVDRTRLGAVVFADPGALSKLEALTHPAVREEIRKEMDSLEGSKGFVVLDAVKLLQSELLPLCNAVWVVRCGRDVQLNRLLTERGMSPEEARNRIRAQPSFEHSAVTAVIENSATREELQQQVQEQLASLLDTWFRSNE